ncbi:MAG TPA: malto-oligosyltrehalose synthase [Polyangiaceae bacterium]
MRIPSATYRLQLNEAFGFFEAARVAPYLERLGVSDIYISPIFKAAPGSTHGYDVLDHDQLNPELGGAAGFQALTDAAQSHDLGLIVDFVPNHMGVGCDGNRWWEDVLEHGQASEHAEYFDIDWLPPKETLAHKLLLPILPEQYGVSLESGYFSLHFDGNTVRLRAGARNLPLRPQSLARVLRHVADLMEGNQALDPSVELRQIADELSELDEGDPGRPLITANYRRKARSLQHRLRESVSSSNLQLALAQALTELSGVPSRPESFDFLDDLLRAQHYRLSAWHLALEAINYRRFFDVTELAAIRVELPQVFEASHRTLLSLIEHRKITGIRLDHVDGLFDPVGYLRQLSERLREGWPDAFSDTRRGSSDPAELPVYVIVEKILAPGESLPAGFRAHGTTGYDFVRAVGSVLIDHRSELSLSNTYRHFTGDTLDFDDHLLAAKRDVLSTLLASDAAMLSRALERLAEQDRRWRDLTWHSLHSALVEVMAAFGAYRSYVRPDGWRSAEDESLINAAVAVAIRRNPTANRGPYQFLRSLLLLESTLPGAREFAMRFQQTTGPVTAKALEDTVFYRYTRNLAENEVGGRPNAVGLEQSEFHAQNLLEQSEHKLSLTATSTHDTKRGEDARARLGMLSELPNTWRRTVHELARLASRHRTAYDGREAPARSDEYLFYQTLIGVIPFGASEAFFAECEPRLQAYMLKAIREAKTRSSWLNPDLGYEAAVRGFLTGTLSDPEFTAKLLVFCRRIEPYAACKALAQLTLKLCSPGIPDSYQGSEVWHQVLVDPDNRRPVDYGTLESQLAALDELRNNRNALISRLLESYPDGRIKLFIVSELLRLRRAEPELFQSGYAALEAGADAIAFGRGADSCALVCVVTRFPFRVTRGRVPWPLGAAWTNQTLSGCELQGEYRNVLTAQTVRAHGSLALSQVFADFPVAVLRRVKA